MTAQITTQEAAPLELTDCAWADYRMTADGKCYVGETKKALGETTVRAIGRVLTYAPPASQDQINFLLEHAKKLQWPVYADWGRDRLVPEWLPIEEALEGVTFREELRGYHSGQKDLTLTANLGQDQLGHIDYSLYQDSISVQMIFVKPLLRRGGIATQMAKELQRLYPESDINWGMSSEEGTRFLNALDRRFDEDPSYAEAKRDLDAAKAEYEALQSTIQIRPDLTPDERAEMVSKGERLNELDSLIHALEEIVRELKPGKWKIKTESIQESESEDVHNFVTQALIFPGKWEMTESDDRETTFKFFLQEPYGLVTDASHLEVQRDSFSEERDRFVWVRARYAIYFFASSTYSSFGFECLPVNPSRFDELLAAYKDAFIDALKPRIVAQDLGLKTLEPTLRLVLRRVCQAFKVDFSHPGIVSN